MPWDVEVTDQFEEWWDALHEAEQDALDAAVEKLEMLGPALGRPLADTLKESRHPNIKELRPPGGTTSGCASPSIRAGRRYC